MLNFKNIITFFAFLCLTRQASFGSLTADSTKIIAGQQLFELNCASCHNFKIDGIGPQLGGIMETVGQEWIAEFIKNPKAKIDQKDKRALANFKKFKTFMPAFDYLDDAEIGSLIAFINSKPSPKASKVATLKEILDPIPQKIQMSDIVLKLNLFTQLPFSSETKLHTRIVKMDFHPQTHENFILDLNGKMYQLKDKTPIEYLDMAKYMPNFIIVPGLATGFGSFAFHPEFAKNGLIYTSHTEKAGSSKADFFYADSIPVKLQYVITEWQTNQPLSSPFVGVHRELFRINMVTQIHGVQDLEFNPYAKPGTEDYGLLYIGVGDGGSVGEGYWQIPNNPKHIWGNILRIDPKGKNSKNGKYGIPISNPYAKTKNLGEIYAMGFRNPHRFSWTKSGKMLATNIGQMQIEAINLIKKGKNYGWPKREGTFLVNEKGNINKVFPLPKDDAKYNFTYPVAQLDHDEIAAISGGFEYLGNEIPALKGKYIFGSIVDGRLFYVNEKDLLLGKQAEIKEWQVSFEGKITKLNKLTNNDRVDLRIGKDFLGELYIFTKPDGKVYKLSN
jgi:mono/diheme cytochrome c family protein